MGHDSGNGPLHLQDDHWETFRLEMGEEEVEQHPPQRKLMRLRFTEGFFKVQNQTQQMIGRGMPRPTTAKANPTPSARSLDSALKCLARDDRDWILFY